MATPATEEGTTTERDRLLLVLCGVYLGVLVGLFIAHRSEKRQADRRADLIRQVRRAAEDLAETEAA